MTAHSRITGRGGLLAVLLGIALGTGCVHNAFTPATTMKLAARPAGCYLDLILHGEPPFPYVVIGHVSTESTAGGWFAIGENNEVAMERLQDEACSAGAHGLIQPDSQAQGVWTQNGYSKSTTGTAVAFVYVDPSGRALPPPTGPRLIIHPGGVSGPTPPPPLLTPSPPLTPPPTAVAPSTPPS